jgi:hypothetical protein
VRRLLGPRPPADVLDRAALRGGESSLAEAVGVDGTWLLGTRDALLLVPPGSGPARRVPWEQVENADWLRDEERLRVTEVGVFGQARPQHSFVIERPGQLPALVRERVTASVVLQRRVAVERRRGLTVVARRPPRGTGQITWAYELDAGLNPDDPLVREAAERGLRAAMDELGEV